MASKNMNTKVLIVIAMNILLFSHLSKPAHGTVTVGICPRSLAQVRTCANDLLDAATVGLNVGISDGGVTVGVPVGAPLRISNCCTLIRGLTDSETSACISAAVRVSLLGIVLPNVDFGRLVRNVCARLPGGI